MIVYTNNTEAMRINSSGNVGIGTASPALAGGGTGLHINATSYPEIKFTNGTTGVGAGDGSLLQSSGNNFSIQNREAGSITFSTSNTERMRIDASGNLLVAGTNTNPVGNNVVGHALSSDGRVQHSITGTTVMKTNQTTDGDIIQFRVGGSSVGSIGSYASARLRIGSSAGAGMVFGGTQIYPATDGTVVNNTHDLGTASYRWKDLYLSGTANVGSVNVDQNNAFTNTNITSANTNVDKGNFLRFMQVASGSIPAPDFVVGHAGDNTGDAVLLNISSSHMKFYTNNTEKVRITANGELLVGTTSSSSNTAGIKLSPTGTASFVRSGVQPLYVNRLTSDGDLAVFAKDGTTVGSIGTAFTNNLFVGSSNIGLSFISGNASIYPMNPSNLAIRDGEVNLGNTGARFNNLWLSGGVYLGGTGAANKLDDYEEGTWTPVFKRNGSSNNATIVFQGANYVKTGNQVTVTVYVSSIDYSPVTNGDFAVITGLPFTSDGWHSGSIGYGGATNVSETTWVLNSVTGNFLAATGNGFYNGNPDLNRGMFTATYITL